MGDTRLTRKFKVVLLGEGRVGKTSILLRYIRGEYDDRQVSTLQASYLDKKLMVDNTKVQLSLWDTAGQERFHALGPIYYRDADGALLVYDITDDESFKKVRTWVRELRRVVGDDIDIVIAGNKVDLHRNRKVDEEEAKKYAASVGASHFHTSAKLNRGLEDVFVDVTKRMLGRKSTKKGKVSTLIADDDTSYGNSPVSNAREPVSLGPGFPSSSQHSAARPATNSGLNEPTTRSRQGGRGQTIQIVDDDSPSPATASNGIRIRGAQPNEVPKQKSGCC